MWPGSRVHPVEQSWQESIIYWRIFTLGNLYPIYNYTSCFLLHLLCTLAAPPPLLLQCNAYRYIECLCMCLYYTYLPALGHPLTLADSNLGTHVPWKIYFRISVIHRNCQICIYHLPMLSCCCCCYCCVFFAAENYYTRDHSVHRWWLRSSSASDWQFYSVHINPVTLGGRGGGGCCCCSFFSLSIPN